MGQSITHDDIKDIGEKMTKDNLRKGAFLALIILIGVRFLSFFTMNNHL